MKGPKVWRIIRGVAGERIDVLCDPASTDGHAFPLPRDPIARVTSYGRRFCVQIREGNRWAWLMSKPVSPHGTRRIRSWESRASARAAAERYA